MKSLYLKLKLKIIKYMMEYMSQRFAEEFLV